MGMNDDYTYFDTIAILKCLHRMTIPRTISLDEQSSIGNIMSSGNEVTV